MPLDRSFTEHDRKAKMARPKTDPDAPSLPKTPQEAMEQGYFTVDDVDPDNVDDPTIAALIVRLTEFLELKREALTKISKGRTIGHGLIETGIGSRSQAEWLRFYVPLKTRNKAGAVVDSDDDDTEDNGTEATEE